MEFYVSIQLGISSSQLTNSYVSEGVVQPPTRNRSELDVLQRSHKMLPFRCLAIEMSLDVTSHGFHTPKTPPNSFTNFTVPLVSVKGDIAESEVLRMLKHPWLGTTVSFCQSWFETTKIQKRMVRL